MENAEDTRTLVRLQAATVALLAIILTLFIVGGAWAFSKYRQLTAQVQRSGDIETLQKSLRELTQLSAQLTERQDAFATALGERADATQKRIAALEERRHKLAGIEKGLIDKTEQMIAIQQLMVDEMIVLLRHFASTQEAVGKVIRPGAEATGGAGEGGKDHP